MGRGDLVTAMLDTDRHPLTDVAYQTSCANGSTPMERSC